MKTDRDRQTHGRGYMYLAQAVHIVYCKAVDLYWCVCLCQELVHRQTETDRQTHGRGYMYLAQAVHIVRCKAADLCSRHSLRNLSTDRQTDRQTHGRGYMYLAVSVHIVYCKAADLCWRVDLSPELVQQTDRPELVHI